MDKHKDGDHVENYDDVSYVVENEILEMGGEFTVDYESNFFARGFTVRSFGGSASRSC